jgi:hypothetical protein
VGLKRFGLRTLFILSKSNDYQELLFKRIRTRVFTIFESSDVNLFKSNTTILRLNL